MKIAFLHTSTVHIGTFDALLGNEPGIELIHNTEAGWLAEAISTGLTDELSLRVTSRLTELRNKADVVICTCSSLGPLAQQLQIDSVFRVDEPMMQAAARQAVADNAPALLVMCLESTVKPSSALLKQAFTQLGSNPNYRTLVCSQAWPHFEAKDNERFSRTIAAAILKDVAHHEQTGCIVLAQASMAGAGDYLSELSMPMYASPSLAAQRALSFRPTT